MQYVIKSLVEKSQSSSFSTKQALEVAKYGLFMSFFPGIYFLGQFFLA